MSPTQRSLKYLRDRGYFAGIVEKWNPWVKIRQDLFGWVDIVSTHPQKQGTTFVQTTTSPNMRARVKKAAGNAALISALLAGNTLEVHGWRKVGRSWVADVLTLAMGDLVRGEGAECTSKTV